MWIGERCFPYPPVLAAGGDRRLLDCSIFVSPRKESDRLWAVDLSLRSPVVGLVIADGSRFDMAATRRVQLLAKSHGTTVLLVRPPREVVELSAAQTRWLVRWEPPSSNTVAPRWSVELLRCKGVQPNENRRLWVLEWNRAACTLDLSAAMAHPQDFTKTIAGEEVRSAYRYRSA